MTVKRRDVSWLRPLLACTVFLVCASPVRGADLVVIGNLRSVATTFITLRVADGRVVDARLPRRGPFAAVTIVGQYGLGDQVQIVCKTIAPDFDVAANRSHSLEVTGMRYLQPPTPEEVLGVRASLSWHTGGNLLQPSRARVPGPEATAAPVPEGFDRIRQVNRARIDAMPTFLADEIATRWRRQNGATEYRRIDTIESEISVRGGQATRQRVRINGKAWSSRSPWLPGPNWGFGFGTDLQPLFDPRCVNEFTAAGQDMMHDRPVRAYSFRAPRDGCFGPITFGFQQYAAEHRGRILIDDEGNVVQVEHETVGTPRDLGQGSRVVLTWDTVRIGGAPHLLPIAVDWEWNAVPDGETWHVYAEYRNHHHFETEVTVRPEGEPPSRK